VGSEDACEGLAAALAGVEGVAVAEELLPYVVCAVVLQPYASAKLVSPHTLSQFRCATARGATARSDVTGRGPVMPASGRCACANRTSHLLPASSRL